MRVVRAFGTVVAAASTLVPVTACGAGDPADAGTAVRDSAGIEIVESTAPRRDRRITWRLSASPSVDIGVLDGAPEYQLFQVTGAVRLTDSRLAIANRGTHEIRFYDTDGRHLRSAGRQGGGPGEFEGLSWLGAHAGDTLVAFDSRHRRLSVFGPDGELARTVPLEPPGATPFFAAGLLADGSLVSVTSWTSRGDPPDLKTGTRRLPSAVIRHTPDGELADTLMRVPGFEQFVLVSESSRIYTNPPFPRGTTVNVHAGRLYVATRDDYELAVHHPDGMLERLIRRPDALVAVTQEDIDRYEADRLERAAENPRWLERAHELLAAMEFPATFPAFGAVEVDADGRLWVADYRRPDDAGPTRWTLFDVDGAMLGHISMPRRFRVFEIGADYVLGRWVDDLDVEHVRMHRLIKAEG